MHAERSATGITSIAVKTNTLPNVVSTVNVSAAVPNAVQHSLLRKPFSLESLRSLAYSETSKMGESGPYFLVPACSGLSIQLNANSFIYTADVQGKAEQQWYIELGDNNKIAFRNGAKKQYLRARGGHNSAHVQLGEKQFWKLVGSKTPGAFWIRNEDFPKAYLCCSGGRFTPNNLIYMWAPEPYWTQSMLWYIQDVQHWKDNADFAPTNASLSAVLSPKSLGEVKAKEQALNDRERELDERQRAMAEIVRKRDEQDQKLEDREQSIAERDRKVAEREKAIADKERELEEKEKAIADKQKELEDKEKSMPKKPRKIEQRDSPVTKTGASGREENGDQNATQDQIAKLRKQLEEAQEALQDAQTKEQETAKRERDAAAVYEKFRQTHNATSDTSPSADKGEAGDGAIYARRVHPMRNELQAANVGERWQPPGFRLKSRSATTRKGHVPPIEMPDFQSNFVLLPRLR